MTLDRREFVRLAAAMGASLAWGGSARASTTGWHESGGRRVLTVEVGQTGKLHYPLTVDGYRVVYKGYLADPDLQDARARWPFAAPASH